MTRDAEVIGVSFGLEQDFDACRRKLIDEVDKRFPTGDDRATVEVDVVAVSMGGLVARYAAMPVDGQRRLRIVRLFTMATPHRGATAAALPLPGNLVESMRPGSAFLQKLDAALPVADYELVCYAALKDSIVGEFNTAPAGRTAWWVPTPALQEGHLTAYLDTRIVADIARRLRGETPFTTSPPAPLPPR